MSCASAARNLLLSAVAAACLACAQTRSPPVEDGTYLRLHVIAVNPLLVGRSDTLEWQRLPVTDCLRVESHGADEVSFDIVFVQSNLHSCSASGVARRRPGSSDFEAALETAEPTPCHLLLRFGASEVAIEDLDGCRSIYCGAYAGLDTRFDAASRRSAPMQCEEAPKPDFDSGERAAERLLEEWEQQEHEAGATGVAPE